MNTLVSSSLATLPGVVPRTLAASHIAAYTSGGNVIWMGAALRSGDFPLLGWPTGVSVGLPRLLRW